MKYNFFTCLSILLLVTTTACQTPVGARNPSSETTVQIPVLPIGSDLAFGAELILPADASNAEISFQDMSAHKETTCSIVYFGYKPAGTPARIKKGSHLTITQSSVSPQYKEDSTGEKSLFISAKTSYSLKRSSSSTTDFQLICETCKIDDFVDYNSCVGSSPQEVIRVLQTKGIGVRIGEGSSVRNVPKEIGIIDIKFEQAPQEMPGAVSI